MRLGRSWGRLGMKYKLGDVSIINPRETIKKGTIAKKVDMAVLQPFTRKIPSFELLEYKGGTKFRNGDTIMARITPCLENGKTSQVSILDDNEIGFGSTEYIVFRAKEGISDCNFLYYLVCSDIVRDPAIKSMVGSSGRQRVQTDVIQNLEIDLPSLEIQKQIASILSALDEKIEFNNRINENLESQAQAIFKSWFVDFEPFGGVKPEEWTEKSVYDLAEYINGAAFKKNEYSTEGIPIIKIAELKNGITDSTQYCCIEKDEKYYFDNKAILFSWSGNPETSIDTFLWYRGKAILNQHTFRVVSKYNASAFTYFLLKYLKPKFTHIASNKQTTGLGHVTVSDLKRLQFSCSTDAIEEFEKMSKPLFDMIYNTYVESNRLSKLRDVLLPKLMNGEIDVSEVKI